MHVRKKNIALAAMLALSAWGYSQEVLQWRGPDRTGIYPESNLLKAWPTQGPALIWESADIGNGYGSPIITSNNIYVEGEIDTINYLFSLDLSGRILWKAPIGKEWVVNYPGDRSTPTLVGELIYSTAGWGDVACFDAQTGAKKWSVNLIGDFHAKQTRFGFAESVLVDDDKVFLSVGSVDTNVVALNRFTGKIEWISKAMGQMTSFCSPMLIKLPARSVLVTFSKNILLGIDAGDGRLLWSHQQEGEDVQANTPYFENGYIYYVSGDGNGAVKLKLSEDGSAIEQVWRNPKCDNIHGGFVKVNDYIYTSGYGKRVYFALDAKNGELTDSVKFDRGSIIAADNLLYLYNERGQMGLYKPNGPRLQQISTFKVTKGSKAHYAHPVICRGVLYIRHGKSLLAYNINNQ